MEEVIVRLHQKCGVRFFGAGGALGFDTLAAEAVIKLRKDYPGLALAKPGLR